MRALKAVSLCLLIGAAFGACRNPFDPEADIRLIRFYAPSPDGQSGYVYRVQQLDAGNKLTDSADHHIGVQVYNYSSVAATFRSYTVVYKQVGPQGNANLGAGLPIPTLGGAAGRRFMAGFYINGRLANSSDFIPAVFNILVLTNELFLYIADNEDTDRGGVDCEITFYGVDENDHEVTVGGTFHVEVY